MGVRVWRQTPGQGSLLCALHKLLTLSEPQFATWRAEVVPAATSQAAGTASTRHSSPGACPVSGTRQALCSSVSQTLTAHLRLSRRRSRCQASSGNGGGKTPVLFQCRYQSTRRKWKVAWVLETKGPRRARGSLGGRAACRLGVCRSLLG